MCQATGLRCFRHFYHCHDKLHKLRIQIKEEQKFFLEAVIGKGQVSDGILDAKDKPLIGGERITGGRRREIQRKKCPRSFGSISALARR